MLKNVENVLYLRFGRLYFDITLLLLLQIYRPVTEKCYALTIGQSAHCSIFIAKHFIATERVRIYLADLIGLINALEDFLKLLQVEKDGLLYSTKQVLSS